MKKAVMQRRKFVTTNYIIHELVALLTLSRFHLSRPKVIDAINKVKSDPSVEILHVVQAIDNRAWTLLETRLDKEWSLVDATSIIIMKDFGMKEALSTDNCFPQEGLIKLLDARSTP